MTKLINSKNISYTVNTPSLKYLTELVRLKCSPDLIQSRYFPNAKEVTESFAAYNAVRQHLQDLYDFQDPNVRVVVVGDGVKPRTGATFAFRTNWIVCSVDPLMFKTRMAMNQYDPRPNNIKKLMACRSKIEYLDTSLLDLTNLPLIIVCVHSHAKLSHCLAKLQTRGIRSVISIPCCVPDDLSIAPSISYQDYGIHSDKRTVNIYKNIQALDSYFS